MELSLARRGLQVAYLPDHAEGDFRHPDVEFGFITSVDESTSSAWCRFWRRPVKTGILPALRTTANSEKVSIRHLIIYPSTDQANVDEELSKL